MLGKGLLAKQTPVFWLLISSGILISLIVLVVGIQTANKLSNNSDNLQTTLTHQYELWQRTYQIAQLQSDLFDASVFNRDSLPTWRALDDNLKANLDALTRYQGDHSQVNALLSMQQQLGQHISQAPEQLTTANRLARSVNDKILSQISAINARREALSVSSDNALLLLKGLLYTQCAIVLLASLILMRATRAYYKSAAKTKRLARFPENSPTAIITLDQHNQVTYLNPACLRLLGAYNLQADTVLQAMEGPLHQAQKNLMHTDLATESFVLRLRHYVFRCELHSQADAHQWDIHISDETAQAEAQEQLRMQAYQHPDSGLPNQNAFQHAIADRVSLSLPFKLGFAEIRSFSELLRRTSLKQSKYAVSAISAILHKACNGSELEISLYHIGDKTFALIIHSEDESVSTCDIDALISTITSELNRQPIIEGYLPQLDFGFACFPEDSQDAETLINFARITLDNAAGSDHQRYGMFNRTLHEQLDRQQFLIEEIRRSIDSGGFELEYQPQCRIESQTCTGVEALLRWRINDDLISPSEFIPVAERSGLIVDLGNWVLNTACGQAVEWLKSNPNLVMAVNISPVQFVHPKFVSWIEQALHDSRLPPGNLELEMTEGVLLQNSEQALARLEHLKQMGVRLSVDDFGTGYSSLSYLKHLPFHKLKIDQSFVTTITEDKADQSIVRAIIDLAHDLGLEIIAEGVETDAQASWLEQNGCHTAQGAWFSAAKPAESIGSLISQETIVSSGSLQP